MQKKAKRSAISLLMAVLMVFSVFTGIMPALAAENGTSGMPVMSGLAFNGTSQYVLLDRTLGTDLPTVIEIVMKADGHGRQILFGNYGSGNSMNVEIYSADQLRYYENDSPNLVTTRAPEIWDGEWHTITFVRDVAGRRGAFYVDGELFQEWTNVTFSQGSTALTSAHIIGADQRSGKIYTKGTIAEVRLWNVLQTEDEIKENVNFNLTGSETGLAHLYQLNNSSIISQTVTDKADAANKIDGRLIGFTAAPLEYSGLYFGTGRYAVLDRTLDADIPVTIEAIVQITTKGARQLIFSNYITGAETSMNVELTAANQLRYYESGTNVYTNALPDSFFDGKWHTVTCIRDLANNRVTFYVDGILFYAEAGVNLRNGMNPLNAIHCIGADLRSSKIYFNGSISEIRLWDAIRTTAEIETFVNTNIAGNEAGLMHLWQFDNELLENSPQIVADKSAFNPNNATLVGFPVMVKKDGLKFNGSNQYIEMDAALEKPVATVEIWTKVTAKDRRLEFFGNYLNGNERSYNVEIDANNKWRYWENRTLNSDVNVATNIDLRSSASVVLNEWVLLTYVRDTVNGQIRLYLNGVLTQTWNGFDFSNECFEGAMPFFIGSDQRRSSTLNFDGYIAEIRMWDTIRTDAEIANSVNAELTGTETGLAHLWIMDESTPDAGRLYDMVSGGINGTPRNWPKKISVSVAAPTGLLSRGDLVSVDVTVTNSAAVDCFGASVNVVAPYSAIPVSIPNGGNIYVPAGGQTTLTYQYRIIEGGREAFRVKLEKDGAEIDSATAGVSVAGPGFYRGDNHSHSIYSDGAGTIAQNAAQAFNVQMLSWLNSTDHNTMNQLADTQVQTALYGGRFINLASDEYTSSTGHALTLGSNLVLPTSLIKFRGDTEGWQSVIDATNAAGGAFYIAHNYEGGVGHNYDYTVETLAALRNHAGMEVWNNLNRNAHDSRSRMQFDAWDMMNAQGTGKYAGLTVSDSHSVAKIGDAHIKAFLPSLTTANINAILKNGNYIGTNGPEIRFDIDGVGISDTLKVTSGTKTANFNIRAYCPVSNLTKVEIIKSTITGSFELNRETVWSVDLIGANINTFDEIIQLEVKPGEFYRVEVNSEKAATEPAQTGYAYTNNIWIETAGKSNATDLRDIQYIGNGIEIKTLPTGILYMSGSEGTVLALSKLTASIANGAKLEKSYDENTRMITLKVTAEDGTVSVKEVYVLESIGYVPVEPEVPTVVNASASAAIINNGMLVVAVTEILSDGTTNTISERYTVDSDAEGTYAVGEYKVYVAIAGGKVTECYTIVETDATTLVSAATTPKDFVSIVETAKNSGVWVLTFNVAEVYSNGETKVATYSVNLKGNNANLDGKYTFTNGSLKGYTLMYDIKGNGTNIKEFRLTK